MYSNSKEQISLEEAYRKVYVEEKECPCGGHDDSDCQCDDKCEKCHKLKDECECENVNESLVGVASSIVAHDTPGAVISDLARWAFVIGGTIANTALFLNKDKAAQFIAELMEYGQFKTIVKEIEDDLRSDDINRLKHAHNQKVRLLRLLDNVVIRKAVQMGLLDNAEDAIDKLNRDIDTVDQHVKEIQEM
jgi:hypothetical protein